MVLHKPTPVFRELANEADLGLVLKPLLRAYLYDAKFPGDFSVRFEKHDLDFGPDGWFHPSTHPLWPARMLYYYLTEPQAMIPEMREYMGTLSITFGKAMHGFITMCLQDQGVLLTPEDFEAEGIAWNPKTGEPIAIDRDTGSRGSMDGILRLQMQPYIADGSNRQVFEFKTRSPKAKVIPDLDLEAYKEKYDTYYAQNQDYMRMTGYRMTIVLLMSLGYPWEMTEVHVPFDPKFALAVRDKYVEVRSAAAAKSPPLPCCGVKSKEAKVCPARTVCPVGMVS